HGYRAGNLPPVLQELTVHRILVLALASGVAACASSAGARSASMPGQQTVVISGPDKAAQDVRLTRDDHVASALVPAPPAQTWAAVPDAFAAVGLPAPHL